MSHNPSIAASVGQTAGKDTPRESFYSLQLCFLSRASNDFAKFVSLALAQVNFAHRSVSFEPSA
ncbi:hypothetical protein I7I48_00423 [Histoplasma ohiense]|nr:hypothetical protein I7I48_00423 [Histoplasma ohiense (nom. inval.)]